MVQQFQEPTPGSISAQDIAQRDRTGERAKKLADLLNLAGYEASQDYEVGNYAKRVFNRVKSNLLARAKGLTDNEIVTITKSLKSVLTKDRILQDMSRLKVTAKRNIKTKLGANRELQPILAKVLAVDVREVPPEKYPVYQKILQEFGQRKQILTIEDAGQSFNDAQEFLKGLSPDLFAKKEKVEKVSDLSKPVLIKQVLSKKIDASKITNADELADIKELQSLKEADLEFLDEFQLELLVEGISSINGGVFSPALKDIIIDLKANKDLGSVADVVKATTKTTWKNALSRFLAKGKSIATKGSTTFNELIRTNPLTIVDQIFGGKGQAIYNATFGKLASAYSKFETLIKGIEDRLDQVENKLNKKFKGNKLAKAKFLIKTYQIQREYEANKEAEGVAPAIEWLEKTLADENNTGFYSDASKELIREVIAENTVNGQFNAEAIFKKFGEAEKEAIIAMDDINNNLVGKILYTSGVLRGKQATLYSLYTSHNTIDSVGEAGEVDNARRRNFLSAEGSATQERTPGVKAISMDPFYDVAKSARGVLLDYHMTPVNREVLRITQRTIKAAKGVSKEAELGAAALDSTVKEVLENVFAGNTVEHSNADAAVQAVKTAGYLATLASLPRAIAELTSNVSFGLLAAGSQLSSGATKHRKWAMAKDGALILNNVGSGQTGKLYETGIEGSKHVDAPGAQTRRKQAEGFSQFEDSVRGAAENIVKYSGAGFAGRNIYKLAEKLISSPDRMVSRPIWYGGFAEAFQKFAGEEVDFQKIKEGNGAYIEKHAAAIKLARQNADQLSVMAGATNNPFSGIISIQEKKHKKGIKNIYRVVSGYFQRFLIFEYTTAKTGVMSLIGEGHLTRKQGILVMAGATSRMALYGTVYAMMSDALAEALGFEGEDDEDEDWAEMLRKDTVGALLTLFTGRNLTAIPKIPINAAIEAVNKGIVGDDYDPFKDSIVWSQLGSKDFGYGKSFADFLAKISGPLGPPIKGGNEVWKEIAKYRAGKLELGDLSQKAAFQVLGYAGLFPLFKDVNKIYKQERYRNSQKKKTKKKKGYGLDLDLDLDIDLDLDLDI